MEKENSDIVADPLSAFMAISLASGLGGGIGALISAAVIAIGRPVVAAVAKIFGASLITRESILALDPFVALEPSFWIFFALTGALFFYIYIKNSKNLAMLLIYAAIIIIVVGALKGFELLSNFASS